MTCHGDLRHPPAVGEVRERELRAAAEQRDAAVCAGDAPIVLWDSYRITIGTCRRSAKRIVRSGHKLGWSSCQRLRRLLGGCSLAIDVKTATLPRRIYTRRSPRSWALIAYF